MSGKEYIANDSYIGPMWGRSILKTASITGGTGFIGRELVSRLLGEGIHVKVLTRNPGMIKKLWPNGKI